MYFVLNSAGKRIPGQPRKGFPTRSLAIEWASVNNVRSPYSIEEA